MPHELWPQRGTHVKKPKRVCLYTISLAAGGAERQLVTLAKELKANGMEVHVLCDWLEGEHINQSINC